MSKQPEALRLADAIDYPDVTFGIEAAAELRRQHRVIEFLICDMEVITKSRFVPPNQQKFALASIRRAREAA